MSWLETQQSKSRPRQTLCRRRPWQGALGQAVDKHAQVKAHHLCKQQRAGDGNSALLKLQNLVTGTCQSKPLHPSTGSNEANTLTFIGTKPTNKKKKKKTCFKLQSLPSGVAQTSPMTRLSFLYLCAARVMEARNSSPAGPMLPTACRMAAQEPGLSRRRHRGGLHLHLRTFASRGKPRCRTLPCPAFGQPGGQGRIWRIPEVLLKLLKGIPMQMPRKRARGREAEALSSRANSTKEGAQPQTCDLKALGTGGELKASRRQRSSRRLVTVRLILVAHEEIFSFW